MQPNVRIYTKKFKLNKKAKTSIELLTFLTSARQEKEIGSDSVIYCICNGMFIKIQDL